MTVFTKRYDSVSDTDAKIDLLVNVQSLDANIVVIYHRSYNPSALFTSPSGHKLEEMIELVFEERRCT